MGRNKFDKDVIVCAVQEYLDGKFSQRAIANRLGIHWLHRGIPAYEAENQRIADEIEKIHTENPGATPLCHSDRGFQYTNRVFHAKLDAAGMKQSMSRVAKCIDNGPMEGFWGIIKRERYYGRRFTDKNTLISIEYYNNKRLQRNLDVLTPMEKHNNYLTVA